MKKKWILLIALLLAGCAGNKRLAYDVRAVIPMEGYSGMKFGSALSISPDGNTLAVSTLTEDNYFAGTTSVFVYDGEGWKERASFGNFNSFVARSSGLSENGDRLVLGYDFAVYDWDGESYRQSSNGLILNNQESVRISRDGNVIAAGGSYLLENGESSEPYSAADGNYLLFGKYLALSGDGTVIAQGIPFYSEIKEDGGAVILYRKSESGWAKEETLKSSLPYGYFGRALALSGDGSLLAVSGIVCTNADCSDSQPGIVLFRYENGIWTQGETLLAEEGYDDTFALSLAMSSDGKVIAADSNNPLEGDEGLVYYYVNEGGEWNGTAIDLDLGKSALPQYHYALGLSADGKSLAVGYPLYSDGGLSNVGAVFVVRVK